MVFTLSLLRRTKSGRSVRIMYRNQSLLMFGYTLGSIMIFKQAEHLVIKQLVLAINMRTDIRARKNGWRTRLYYA